MGTWHPPPNARSTARSAVTAILLSRCSNRAAISWAVPPSPRVSTASAPCPTAGHITSASRSSVIRFSQPNLRSPADARMIASYCPSSSLRNRVSTFPRMFSISRSARLARSCAARRKELVPTRDFADNAARLRPTNASRGSSRSGIAAKIRPSGRSVGISLRL